MIRREGAHVRRGCVGATWAALGAPVIEACSSGTVSCVSPRPGTWNPSEMARMMDKRSTISSGMSRSCCARPYVAFQNVSKARMGRCVGWRYDCCASEAPRKACESGSSRASDRSRARARDGARRGVR